MKKVFFLIATIGFLYSCGGSQKAQQEEGSVSEFSEIAKGVKDAHNARISLDYQGTYSGKLPTASGEGMNVSITIEETTFVKKTEYIGKKDAPIEEKGNYTWNDEGSTITLEGVKDSPNKYFVGENTLTQLDMDGNRITGEHADLYILRK